MLDVIAEYLGSRCVDATGVKHYGGVEIRFSVINMSLKMLL